MSLTSPVLLAIVAGLAVVLPVVVIITWRRRPGGVGLTLLRWVAILISQVLMVTAVGLYANNEYGFYNDWGDLAGDSAGAGTVETNGLVAGDGSQGRVVKITVKIPGGRGISAERLAVLVWLPKAYDDPANKHKKFPTVMMLPGQPSGPGAVFNGFEFGSQASAAIAAGKVPPFIAVIPPLMISPPRDTECTDIPDGPQAETWLASSVRTQTIKRMRSDPAKWSAMGFSTGGFCAAKLGLRHRDSFKAAVSIGGYFNALTDDTTGDLFHGDTRLRNQNSPLWLIQQPPVQPTKLLIVVSRRDTESWSPGKPYADSQKMIAAAGNVPGVGTLVLDSGGHSFDTYAPTLPQSLAWLAQVGAIS